ncbi:MAG: transglycosylase SLT domain-containing protein [Vicinamibacterales bacterium]
MRITAPRCAAAIVVGICCLTVADGRLTGAGQDPSLSDFAALGSLTPRPPHPPLPNRPSEFWLVPDRRTARSSDGPVVDGFSSSALARGVALFESGQYSFALTLLSDARLGASLLGDYARYYSAWTRLKMGRTAEAGLGFDALAAKSLEGYLSQAVEMRRAEVAAEQRENARAASILEALSRRSLVGPESVLLKLANAYELSGSREKAIETYRRVWVDYALIPEGDAAGQELERLERPRLRTTAVARLELGRAERLFSAKRWAPAREAFKDVLPVAEEQAPLVELRIAECDYYLKRYAAAGSGAQPFVAGGPNAAEARYFVAAATNGLKDDDRFVALVREMLVDLPTDPWTEEALNLLATYYLTKDEDAQAAAVFDQMLARFPGGRYAERAYWKAGWAAYRAGNDDRAVQVFEAGAARLPRADFRPAWIYWAARAHDRQGRTPEAAERFQLVITDYQNSYYGRQAERRLEERRLKEHRLGAKVLPAALVVARPAAEIPAALPSARLPAIPTETIPTETLIREMVAAGLFDDVERELRYAQRAWGDSPSLQATLAWVSHKRGLDLVSWDRFNSLRGAINQMKRAYPQYIAAGGDQLPTDALGVIFPMDYWTLIRQYATEHDLDPYMMAALIQQESTFTPDVRSAANAYGLMQLIPAAGRQYAKKVGLGRFSVRLLTEPEANIRMGMAYFKDLSDRFGGAHFAIASYNAGPHRVSRWRTEKPGLPDDEFIDDIPYPETQNYVKKVLGMAEDYRRLYGGGLLTPGDAASRRELIAPTPVRPKASASKGAKASTPKRSKAKPKARK